MNMKVHKKYNEIEKNVSFKETKKTPHLPKTKLKSADNIIHNQSTDILPQFMGTYTFPE